MSKGQWFKTRWLLAAAKKALTQVGPMTVGELFRRLITAEVLQDTRRDYVRLSRAMVNARRTGVVPQDWIVRHRQQKKSGSNA